ncbi:MAG TPA: bifunctional diaminohydroxyphosphoribosylaminopyrimidine deaminase/5-amino-6-(5-phosphoribosylamino)uracil reductase RibD [Chitinophagales bacterium]|nr:bifunctional diaminohydroxyphosphoribosylaminopyrimidine deaminase/5-amino-6-(5-phosphoribosylamino)uracil reductase RibD [Chitinophagales bacterium]
METHETYMQRCLDLAIKGMGHVAPNPMVGSVVVHNGVIIGEGYHQQYGDPHAEVNAIASVTDQSLLVHSTLYVNLEPCSHFGKTPPCADLILSKKIPRVVIGSYDPNPKVSGKGIERLRNAGVEVITEVLKAEADYLNRRFLTFYTKQRPFIILKWAQSSDGFMGLNEPKQVWLTGAEAKKLSHKWRTEEQAILVGRNTVTVDDSELTSRLWPGKNPLRIVIDKTLTLPLDKKVFNTEAATLIFNERENKVNGHLEYVKLDFNTHVPQQIVEELYRRNIQSVIIEGGANTLQQFIATNLWDEARVFTTTHVLKEGKHAPAIQGEVIEEIKIEKDNLNLYLNPGS